MIYRVHTKNDFESALNQATSGDSIDGEGAEIELKYSRYLINSKLNIRNIAFYNLRNKEGAITDRINTLTIVNDGGLEIESCGFASHNPHSPGHIGFIKAEKATHLIVENCRFVDANFAGLWLYDCPYTLIDDSQFNFDSPLGYGYGCWQGGSGGAVNQVLKAKRSEFYFTRHAIAGHYNANHIHIEACQFGGTVQQVLDRHAGEPGNSGAWGIGGGSYTVLNNVFNDRDRMPVDVQQPLYGNKITVEGNTFNRVYGKNLKMEAVVNDENVVLNETHSHPQLEWGTNYYVNE